MTQFLLHLTLALLWVLLWGHIDLYTFLAGAFVGSMAAGLVVDHFTVGGVNL